MSLKRNVAKLEKMFAICPRAIRWAEDVNHQAGKIHGDVWMVRPEPNYVAQKVLPLFRQVLDEIRQTLQTGEYAWIIPCYVSAMQTRIRNLTRYSLGLPSDCIPESVRKRAAKMKLEDFPKYFSN